LHKTDIHHLWTFVFETKISSSIDHTTYKYHFSSIEDESNLALHVLADLMVEIIEYEKTRMMHLDANQIHEL
jgi:hypothetical protein